MHFPEADLERSGGKVDIHPRMLEDFLDRDALISWLKDPGNKIFCLLADAFHFRYYIVTSLLSRSYFMVLTDLRIYLSFSPSNGGAAERRM